MSKDLIISFFFSLAIALLIFWQFFLKGLQPFPGNYLLAWYEPWKTDYTVGRTITIPHKPVADDTFRYLYPFKVLSMDIIKRFEFPLWNPYNGAGMPLLATIQSGFLNPANLFFLLFENRLAWTLYIVFQTFLLGFFTYIYCRKIKLSVNSSLFASIIFLFSGFVIARLIFGNIIYPLILLPIILYLIEDFFEHSRRRKIFFLPIAFALLFFVGHPHIVFYVLVFSTAYFLYRYLTTKKEKTLFARFFIFLLLGIGLASIQILPTLELFLNANLNTQSSQFLIDRFLLPPTHLLSILIPNYFGNQSTYNYWGKGDYIETVVSLGLIPCFFAFIALFKDAKFKKNVRLFFLIAVLTTIIMTLNWFVPKFFYSLSIPVISTSPPSRIFMLTTFSLSILAGYGFDRWINGKKISKGFLLRLLPFIVVVLIVILGTALFFAIDISCNNQFITNCRTIALRNTLLEGSVFVIALSGLILYMFFKNRDITRLLPSLMIFLVLILGLYNSNKFIPFSEKKTTMPENPLLVAVKKTTDARIFGFESANIKTNFATYFRFFDPNHFDPIYNKRYAELIGFANTGKFPPPLKRSDIEITKDLFIDKASHLRRERLLNLLGVKYFIFKKNELEKNSADQKTFWEDNSWIIKVNSDALPRVYAVNNFEIVTRQESILKRLFDYKFDYRKKIILEEKPKLQYKQTELFSKGPRVTEYKENSILIQTDSIFNQILVLPDNYFPGWKAFVDGKETKVYRANYTFRAIEIPKGKHHVEFVYSPSSFYTGVVLSSISFMSILFYFVIWPKVSSNKYHRKIA